MLAAFIKERRAQLRISQAELGKRARVSQAFVNKLEHGTPIPLDKIDDWVDALGLERESLAEFETLCLGAQSSHLAASLKQARAFRLEMEHLLYPVESIHPNPTDSKKTRDELLTELATLRRANRRMRDDLAKLNPSYPRPL